MTHIVLIVEEFNQLVYVSDSIRGFRNPSGRGENDESNLGGAEVTIDSYGINSHMARGNKNQAA